MRCTGTGGWQATSRDEGRRPADGESFQSPASGESERMQPGTGDVAGCGGTSPCPQRRHEPEQPNMGDTDESEEEPRPPMTTAPFAASGEPSVWLQLVPPNLVPRFLLIVALVIAAVGVLIAFRWTDQSPNPPPNRPEVKREPTFDTSYYDISNIFFPADPRGFKDWEIAMQGRFRDAQDSSRER